MKVDEVEDVVVGVHIDVVEDDQHIYVEDNDSYCRSKCIDNDVDVATTVKDVEEEPEDRNRLKIIRGEFAPWRQKANSDTPWAEVWEKNFLLLKGAQQEWENTLEDAERLVKEDSNDLQDKQKAEKEAWLSKDGTELQKRRKPLISLKKEQRWEARLSATRKLDGNVNEGKLKGGTKAKQTVQMKVQTRMRYKMSKVRAPEKKLGMVLRGDSSIEKQVGQNKLVGLENLDNTCYLNAVLQCLRGCTLLRDIITHTHIVPTIGAEQVYPL